MSLCTCTLQTGQFFYVSDTHSLTNKYSARTNIDSVLETSNHSQGRMDIYNHRQLNVMHPFINSLIIKWNSIRLGSICQTPDQMLSELYSLPIRSAIRLCSASTAYYICRVSGLLKLFENVWKKSKFNYYQ